MKTKIFFVLLFVLLAGGSLVVAGDQKPFNGWITAVASEPISVDEAKTYPYLAAVMEMRGEPDFVSLMFVPPALVTFEGKNNVGGQSTHDNAQLFYLTNLDPSDPSYSHFIMEFYEDVAITVANGDQIFVNIQGIYYPPIDKIIAKEIVVGGTGRFEGATGVFDGFWDSNKDVVYDGYIETPGKAE